MSVDPASKIRRIAGYILLALALSYGILRQADDTAAEAIHVIQHLRSEWHKTTPVSASPPK